VSDKFIELKKENKQLLQGFQSKLEEYKTKLEAKENEVEYTLGDYDYHVIDEGAVTQRLVGINKVTGETKNFVSLKKAFDLNYDKIEVVGRNDNQYILKLFESSCEQPFISLWVIDLDEKEISKILSTTNLGIFNSDLSKYVFAVPPMDGGPEFDPNPTWTLTSYDIVNEKIEDIYKFDEEKSLVEDEIEEGECFYKKIDIELVDDSTIEVEVFEDGESEIQKFKI